MSDIQEMRESTYLKRRLKKQLFFMNWGERFACEKENDELGKKIPTSINSNLKTI